MLLTLYPAETPDAPGVTPTPESPSALPTNQFGPTQAQSDDILNRMVMELPPRWFSNPAPIRDAVLGGVSDALAWSYSLLGYAKAQTRLLTATGLWIDLFSFDYLGLTTRRRTAEQDADYAARVQKEILRERVTRQGMYQALLDLTGNPPIIIEPWLGANAGGWDVAWMGWDVGNGEGAGIGVDFAIGVSPIGTALTGAQSVGWGDSYTNEVFVTVKRSGVGVGIANSGGWDTGYIGWDSCGQWADGSLVTGGVTDQDIYDVINATKPSGVTVWVQLV